MTRLRMLPDYIEKIPVPFSQVRALEDFARRAIIPDTTVTNIGNIVWYGDSTALDTTAYPCEGLEAFAEALAGLYSPKFDHYLYNFTSGSYDAADVIETGTNFKELVGDNFDRTGDLKESNPSGAGDEWATASANTFTCSNVGSGTATHSTGSIFYTIWGGGPVGGFEFVVNITGDTSASGVFDLNAWYVDDNNYLRCRINYGSGSPVMSVKSKIGGSFTTTYKADTSMEPELDGSGSETFAVNFGVDDNGLLTCSVTKAGGAQDIVAAADEVYISDADLAVLKVGAGQRHGFFANQAGQVINDFRINRSAGDLYRTLNLYNASVSGVEIGDLLPGGGYEDKFAATLANGCDIAVINLGHNHLTKSAANYLSELRQFIGQIRSITPSAAIVLCSQNPKGNNIQYNQNHDHRMATLRQFAADKEYGYIPVYEAWVKAVAGGDAHTDLASDGTHPSGTGITLCADQVKNYFLNLCLGEDTTA